ncbi:MAG TPA: carboxypeptidase-like regulatory domain-containing protein [Cyclobacteriaceae bacterium]|nr:carboxypeptidase-like regulatory domain-containing protein [Cyclobacteriaceae bacterium]
MLRVLLLFCFVPLFTSHSLSQEMTGRVMDAQGISGIAWVKVHNTNTDKYTYTDHEGNFVVFAEQGDTLVFSLKNYHSQTVTINGPVEEPISVYLAFDAVELPEVYVMEKNENTTVQLQGLKKASPGYVPIKPGQLVVGATDDGRPGVALAGPISFFSRSEKHKRQFEKAEELKNAQQEYLEVVHSDSTRMAMMEHFSLSRENYDSLLILFNAANLDHQFRDMEKERVQKLLFYFMNDAVANGKRSH